MKLIKIPEENHNLEMAIYHDKKHLLMWSDGAN